MNWKLAVTVPIALIALQPVMAQCKINNKLFPEGSLYYFTDPVLIYKTEDRELKGNVATDRELYFLALLPKPFPDRKTGKKFKQNLVVQFDNGTEISLKHFDSRYISADTSFVIMFQIPKDSLPKFKENDINSLTTEIYDGYGARTYNLMLHKNAIMEQLKCLIRKTEKKEPD